MEFHTIFVRKKACPRGQAVFKLNADDMIAAVDVDDFAGDAAG